MDASLGSSRIKHCGWLVAIAAGGSNSTTIAIMTLFEMHFFNWTMTAKLSREKSQTAGFNMLRDENKRSASGGHGQWQLRLQQSEEEIHTNRQTIVFGGHTGAAITELLYFSSPFLPVNYSNSGASMCSFQCQQYLQNSANTHLSTVKRAIWVDSIHSLSLSLSLPSWTDAKFDSILIVHITSQKLAIVSMLVATCRVS